MRIIEHVFYSNEDILELSLYVSGFDWFLLPALEIWPISLYFP